MDSDSEALPKSALHMEQGNRRNKLDRVEQAGIGEQVGQARTGGIGWTEWNGGNRPDRLEQGE